MIDFAVSLTHVELMCQFLIGSVNQGTIVTTNALETLAFSLCNLSLDQSNFSSEV